MPSTSGSPRWLLILATGLVPVLLLLALEGALRLAGFGNSWPLFVPAAEVPGYLEINRDVALRFVPDPDQPKLTQADTVYLAEEKPAGALRLVVQGGSSAAGFPFGRFAGLAGMLGNRLSEALDGREVEVVTTAMSAVNSYTLLDFADEIIALEPDAVLVYAGHNEYLGILGVGSAISSGRSRTLTLAFLELRDLRVFQALQWLYGRVRGALGDAVGPRMPTQKNAETQTLMGDVVREKAIPFGSALYERGLEQFRGNLGDLLAAYQRAGIPVYVGTVASNLRDQPPFVSRLAPGVDGAAWNARRDAAVAALARADLEAADAEIAALLAGDADAAEGHFLRGRLLEARGDYAGALAAYRRSRDLDQLRFRAPEAANAIIRELAARHGAVVVEVEAALAAESPNGLIGSELMLEHVHPNLRGYFLIAEAFFDALRATGLVPGGGVDRETAWEWQPVTEPDRLAGEDRLAFLMAHWPFHDPPIPVELPPALGRIGELGRGMYTKELSWTEAMTSALAHYQAEQNYREAARVAVDMAAAFPRASSPNAVAGQLLFREGRREQAVRYFERAARLAPESPEVLLALGTALSLTGQRDRARDVVDELLELAPAHRSAIELRARLGAP